MSKPHDPWEDTLLWPPAKSDVPDQSSAVLPKNAGQLQEHRAEIILTVAVISLFPIFGLFAVGAVAMAITDLRKMSRGQMDQSGRKQTIAGLAIGLVELTIIGCALFYWMLRG
jgi:hypothetical protein